MTAIIKPLQSDVALKHVALEQAKYVTPRHNKALSFAALAGAVHADETTHARIQGAKKRSNPWGEFDMYGNARGWCGDWNDASLAGGEDPAKLAASSRRVYRGGDWSDDASCFRSAYRLFYDPWFRADNHGLRCGCVARVVRVVLGPLNR